MEFVITASTDADLPFAKRFLDSGNHLSDSQQVMCLPK